MSFGRVMVLSVLVLGLAAAPVRAADVGEEFSEAFAALKAYTVEKRDEAATEGRELVDAIGAKMAELERDLERSSDEVTAETREGWKASQAKLVRLREQAAAKLSAMSESAGEAWDDTRDAFSAAASDFAEAVEQTGEDLQR